MDIGKNCGVDRTHSYFEIGSYDAVLTVMVMHPAYAMLRRLEARISKSVGCVALGLLSAIVILKVVMIWLLRPIF